MRQVNVIQGYDMLWTVIAAAEGAPAGGLLLARKTEGKTDALIFVVTGARAEAIRTTGGAIIELVRAGGECAVIELATEDADGAGGSY